VRPRRVIRLGDGIAEIGYLIGLQAISSLLKNTYSLQL
jgi:hypothetical protein